MLYTNTCVIFNMAQTAYNTLYLCPKIPSMAQWARMCSSHDGSDECYVWVQKHGLLVTKTELATTTADCVTFQQKTHWSWAPNIAPSLRHTITYLMANWLHSPPSIMEAAATHPDWNQHIFQVWVYHSLLQGLSQHHYASVYRVFDPPTKDPTQHCARPKKLFYSNRGAGVSTWPCEALVPSQPMPSRSCRMTDGTIFWRCNRGCSFEGKPYEHHPPVSVYSLNPWPLNGDVFPQ